MCTTLSCFIYTVADIHRPIVYARTQMNLCTTAVCAMLAYKINYIGH